VELAKLSAVLLQTFVDAARNKTLRRAAARSCLFFALSPVAMLVLSAALLAYAPTAAVQGWHDRWLAIASFFPSTLPDRVHSLFVNLIIPHRQIVLAAGIFFTLWFVSSGFSEIIEGLDASYDVGDDRSFWTTRSLALALAIVTGGPLLVASGAILEGNRVIASIASRDSGLTFLVQFSPYIQWTVVVVLGIFAFEILYVIGPNVKQLWRSALPGATFAVACWTGLSCLCRFYLAYFSRFDSTFALLGAIVAFVVWLYWTGLLALVGGRLNAGLAINGHRRLQEKSKPSRFTSLDLAA